MQNFDFNFTVQDDVNFNMETGGNVGGVANYNLLDNKPQINGVTLQGNKSGSDLGLDDYTDLSNKPQINGVALSGNKTSVDIKMPFLIVAGETYVIDGTEMTARTGASIMAIGGNKAVGALSLAIGANTIAKGDMSFASGMGSKAVGNLSFAIGANTQAIGDYSFAGGSGVRAVGISSFSFGGGTQANGNYSSAVGGGCIANGVDSFASGCETIADSDVQTVIGKYNVSDDDNRFAFIIGNGNNTHGVVRSNALAVDWQGKLYINNSPTGIDLTEIVTILSGKISEADIAGLRATVADNTANITKNKLELAEIVDSGAKNLLNPAAAVGYVGQSGYPISKSGITYTLDANSETITLSDTATSVSTLRIPITLKAGTYHVSGIPSGGSDSSYRADLREAGGNTFITSNFDYGSGFSFTLSETTSLDYCIRIANGYSPSSVVVSPMICTEAAWSVSQQFVKYRPSYDELITRIEALEQANGISTNAVSQSRSIRTIEDI